MAAVYEVIGLYLGMALEQLEFSEVGIGRS